jgi:hypothetical protein
MKGSPSKIIKEKPFFSEDETADLKLVFEMFTTNNKE